MSITRSNSTPHKKADPFIEEVLGKFKPSEKHTSDTVYAWIRTAEVDVPKRHAMDYYDPETLKKKFIYGMVRLEEIKYVNKETAEIGISRSTHATDKSKFEDIVPLD